MRLKECVPIYMEDPVLVTKKEYQYGVKFTKPTIKYI